MSISPAGAEVLRAGGTRVTVSRSLSFSGVANAVARACFILAVTAYRIPRRAPRSTDARLAGRVPPPGQRPSVAAAVREAARDPRGEHPYFWAPFAVFGTQ